MAIRRTLLFAVALGASNLSMAQLVTAAAEDLNNVEWMVGTWSGHGTFKGDGTSRDVTVKATWKMDGYFLKGETAYDFGISKFGETTFLTFDPETGEYLSHSFSSITPKARVERGRPDGDKLTLVSAPWLGTISRTTLSKVSDTKSHLVTEYKNGEKWDIVLDIELVKE